MYIRHDDLRDVISNMISEVCKDTEIEPKLTLEKNCKVERQIIQMRQG